MKRLWKVIPPCMSDILGFEEVLNHTKGLGVIDDASNYKPLRHERSGDRGGFRKGGFHADVRVVSSEIQEADIITGTEKKVLDAFERGYGQYQPEFVLFTTAPCASMINTDLETVAEQVAEKYGVPAASVKLDGQKDYLYGISCTLEAMGRLLLEKRKKIDGTVNILGYNSVDWAKDDISQIETWLTEGGLHILSRWGVQESTENLKKASAAMVNLVVDVAGFRLARFMEREFGIPYVVGAPFGENQCNRLMDQLQVFEGRSEREAALQKACELSSGKENQPEVVVIGEQLEAEAIRMVLLEKGCRKVSVMSFYEMDKTIMSAGDKKLVSESELEEILENEELRLVIADEDYRSLCRRPVSWVSLPNLANQNPLQEAAKISMTGSKMNQWLDNSLARAGLTY